jgi:hypothetical protein
MAAPSIIAYTEKRVISTSYAKKKIAGGRPAPVVNSASGYVLTFALNIAINWSARPTPATAAACG